MALSTDTIYPLPDHAQLRDHFVSKDLRDIECPMAVIDVSKARKNCEAMLKAVQALDLSFRAHIKTHKTLELTRLQVGDTGPVRLVVSTVSEAEHLLPYLEECKARRQDVNILYGIPPSSTCLRRLRVLREKLGPGSISFLVDHASQVQNLIVKEDDEADESQIPVFIKCDCGYHRAGLPTYGTEFKLLVRTVASSKHVKLIGFYTHNSLSYNANSPEEAFEYLGNEISCGRDAIWRAQHDLPELKSRRLIVSVGATPSASSVQNLLSESEFARRARSQLEKVNKEFELEIHAGVYALLDLQQVATRARPPRSKSDDEDYSMTTDDIGLKVLAEVLSVYSERSTPEALVGAGTLALGREPCKSYPGWATVAPPPWNHQELQDGKGNDRAGREAQTIYSADYRTGWIVDRISQEHGILAWHDEQDKNVTPRDKRERMSPADRLQVGQKILLWPNHACITGAGFPFYLVIDSDNDASQIVDIWVRARGW